MSVITEQSEEFAEYEEIFDPNEMTEEELLEYKQEMRKYYLACLWMEGSKIILFFLIFGALGLVKELCMALFMLLLLRSNGGGIHCKHYLSCFAVSGIVLGAGIYLPMYVVLPLQATLPLLILCAFAGYRLVPIVSESRPAPAEAQIVFSRRITLIVILLFSLVICIQPDNMYLRIGEWVVYIHIVQLVIAKFFYERRNEK